MSKRKSANTKAVAHPGMTLGWLARDVVRNTNRKADSWYRSMSALIHSVARAVERVESDWPRRVRCDSFPKLLREIDAELAPEERTGLDELFGDQVLRGKSVSETIRGRDHLWETESDDRIWQAILFPFLSILGLGGKTRSWILSLIAAEDRPRAHRGEQLSGACYASHEEPGDDDDLPPSETWGERLARELSTDDEDR
jgi:hypothetical protein